MYRAYFFCTWRQTMEAVPVTEPQAESGTSQIKQIKREQKKDGVNSFLVVFDGDANDKGRWVEEAYLPSDAVNAFREQKKSKGKAATPKTAESSKARKIKEIKGMIPSGDDIFFVVRFRDGTKDEAVCKATMHSTYVKDLLKFYESNIERVPIISTPSA